MQSGQDDTRPAGQRYRVVIVGGGPAGCACALALAQRGVPDILVVEAGDYSQFRLGESILPEAFRLFQTLGVDQEFLREGHAPCYGSCSYWGSDKRGYNDALMNPLGHGWHLDRRKFNLFLAAQARRRGVELLANASLAASAAARGPGFVLQLALGTPAHRRSASIHADFVVDASGTRAAFARQRGSRKLGTKPQVCLAARFTFPHRDQQRASERSSLTHLEAVEDGWWYGAHLPDDSLLLTFNSDATTVKTRQLQQPERWMAQLSAAANTAALAHGAVPLADMGGILSCPAPSYCLDHLGDDGWLAIGDAAAAYDPITSQGIVKAIANGIAAADVIAGAADARLYAQSVKAQYRRYLALRHACYGWERRWPDAPFWKRHHAEPGIPSMREGMEPPIRES